MEACGVVKTTNERPWTELENLVLVNSPKKMIIMLAELMDRTVEEVSAKHTELQAVAESRYREKVRKMMEAGMSEDDAYLMVVEEEKKKYRKILNLGNSLTL